MLLNTANGTKEYNVSDLDFTNMMCDLEDNGVDVMKMMSGGTEEMKVFKTMRAILAALIGEKDLRVAGKIISEHLTNGGEMDVIFNEFTKAMSAAGFGEASEKKGANTKAKK